MSRDFSARTDIDNTDPTNFPDGRILDSNPPTLNNGTAIAEDVLGDLHQFFLKLLRAASITPNGLADTDSVNQLFDAFLANIRATGATESSPGVAAFASQAEVDAGAIQTKMMSPGILAQSSIAVLNASNTVMRSFTVPIGPWNMNTVNTLTVPHTLNAGFFDRLVNVSAIIRNDANTTKHIIAGGFFQGTALPDVYIPSIDATNVTLEKRPGGLFDGIAYDSTAFSRGNLFFLFND